MPIFTNSEIVSHKRLCNDIYDILLRPDEKIRDFRPGQFVNIYLREKTLPRPISVCDINESENTVRLIYKKVGSGTALLSEMEPGQNLNMTLFLGNGIDIEKFKSKEVTLIGGGVGIPPLFSIAKTLNSPDSVRIITGFQNREGIFLSEELEKYGRLHIATDDGSKGFKGNSVELLRELNPKSEVIFSCGPTPMLRAVKNYALENNIDTYLSLEEKMACGIGACLSCVCKSREKDAHTNVHNKRVCKEGPVFYYLDIEL